MDKVNDNPTVPPTIVPFNGDIVHLEGVNCTLSLISLLREGDGRLVAKIMAHDIKRKRNDYSNQSMTNSQLEQFDKDVKGYKKDKK